MTTPFVLKARVKPKAPAGIPTDTYNRYLSKEVLEIFGKHILYQIKQEAIKASYLGQVVPKSSDFLSSFRFEVTEELELKVTLDYDVKWAWISEYLEGRKPYPMTWLTKQHLKERKIIPIKDHKTGEIKFRPVPLTTKQAWIHPGIKKHTFVDAGISKGLIKAYPEVARFVFHLMSGEKVEKRKKQGFRSMDIWDAVDRGERKFDNAADWPM